MSDSRRKRIVLGATGSVASVKVPELAVKLAKFAEVRVVLTKSASHFLKVAESYNPEAFAEYRRLEEAFIIVSYVDEDEWDYSRVGKDPVVHIELRKWADLLLLAPLSANTLGKLSNGICNNLLTSVARAWDFEKPMVVAPAMNTFMWDHPITKPQLDKVQEWGVSVVAPASKILACGDSGSGALAAVDDIVKHVLTKLELPSDLALEIEPTIAFVVRSMEEEDKERVEHLLVKFYNTASDLQWQNQIEPPENDCGCDSPISLSISDGKSRTILRGICVVEDSATKTIQGVSCDPCESCINIRPIIGEERLCNLLRAKGQRCMSLSSIRQLTCSND